VKKALLALRLFFFIVPVEMWPRYKMPKLILYRPQLSRDYMKFLLILAEALNLFKNLLNDLRGKRSLVYLLILAVTVAIASGFILYILDPNIHSLFDGIWSAWVTMTHVGFGDVVPTSFLGRLLSATLILFGLTLFSLFTAILSVTLIGKNMDTWGHDVRQIEQQASRIEIEESQILHELARLHERMDALEKQLSSGTGKDS
jgi:voltage-gated potassium channel